jgi:hypothetical protein
MTTRSPGLTIATMAAASPAVRRAGGRRHDPGDRVPQFAVAERIDVLGVAAAQCLDGRIDDIGGCVEIGLAGGQRDQSRHGRERRPQRRRLDPFDR